MTGGGLSLRRLGVRGVNAPTKEKKVVEPADFSIAGIIGFSERKYTKAFEAENSTEFATIFGGNINSAWYGPDVVESFFANLKNSDGTLWFKSYVGNNSGTIDAAVANNTKQDAGAENAITFRAAYKGNNANGAEEYGISGNRTARKITAVDRFSTTLAANVLATDTVIELTSVVDFRVGDIVRFEINTTVYGKVLSVDQGANTITLAAQIGDTGTIGEDVAIPGFTIQTYRKDLNGVVSEVEALLGAQVCSTESEVTEYYYLNVHDQNRYLKTIDQSSSSTLGDRVLATDADPVYLTSGSDGTAPSTVVQWNASLAAFDNLPVRMLTNAETSNVDIQKAGENYCASRDDTPLWHILLPENQTKDQLEDLGAQYQRSGLAFGIIVADWIKIPDAFNTAPNAPLRTIPNVGHIMGAWINSIDQNGIHYIPATDQTVLARVSGLASENLGDISDRDRTSIAESGVNIIQNIRGSGDRIRNFFTISTGTADRFGNAVIMRNFFKVSFEDSLREAENKPNTFPRIRANRQAMLNFFYDLWNRGSNGRAPLGETFGQFELADGSLSTPDDHFSVQADAINNPVSGLQAGEQNYEAYFSAPTPAGSIEVAVGLLVL